MSVLVKKGENGQYPKYAWPGGYPLYYLSQYAVMCADCASKDSDQEDPITDVDTNWENPLLFCDECGERIESAYADE